MAFYADALAYYPENQRTTAAYLRKVVQGHQKEGFEPLSGRFESMLGGATLTQQDFQKAPAMRLRSLRHAKPRPSDWSSQRQTETE